VVVVVVMVMVMVVRMMMMMMMIMMMLMRQLSDTDEALLRQVTVYHPSEGEGHALATKWLSVTYRIHNQSPVPHQCLVT
jgi:hypothetical protein